MLEGKELEKTFDEGAGKFAVDVNEKGAVVVDMTYEKDLDGYAQVKSSNSVTTNIFHIAEKIAAKTKTQWDDTAIAGLKKLLGIQA